MTAFVKEKNVKTVDLLFNILGKNFCNLYTSKISVINVKKNILELLAQLNRPTIFFTNFCFEVIKYKR